MLWFYLSLVELTEGTRHWNEYITNHQNQIGNNINKVVS